VRAYVIDRLTLARRIPGAPVPDGVIPCEPTRSRATRPRPWNSRERQRRDVRAFASDTLPTLKQHLDEAQRLEKALNGGGSTDMTPVAFPAAAARWSQMRRYRRGGFPGRPTHG
jgi:hypothetical protein